MQLEQVVLGLFYISALSAVLKRATTIKRRGMDVVRQGQPGEEQYGDISSVGEWECAKAQTYGHRKLNTSRCTLSPAAVLNTDFSKTQSGNMLH